MRFSKGIIKTYKEDPKEAEVVSHKLLLRASMIKQIARGNYTYLPLGFRVLKKVENIVRKYMDRAGANEILMPIMQPSDLWIESGRYSEYGPELIRLNDRNNRDFVLGPTYEEVSVFVFRELIKSYKDLPLNMYQIQTKFRDEMRPRFGLMRTREFLMKDAYSYHLTQECLDKEYLNMKNTYNEIFNACGLKFRAVEADTGSIGGSESHEFMVLANSGEDDILYCDESDYAANIEKAKSIIDMKRPVEEKLQIEKVHTPDIFTIEQLAEYLNIPKDKTVKSLIYKDALNTGYYLALIRGDLEINEVKVKNAFGLKTEVELLNDEELKQLNIIKGFMGPIGLDDKIKIVMDESVSYLYNFVIGANEKDYHLKNVNISDIKYDIISDIRLARAGDISPDGRGILKIARGMEVGHIFKLGKKYSESMNAKVLDENGRLQTVIMGCYGIGVSRIIAAAIEQNHDENGIIWPISIAPYVVDIIATNIKDEKIASASENLYKKMLQENIDVIYDDRKEKAGFKFKDADLIGFPIRIVVGNDIVDNLVEVQIRKTGQVLKIEIDKVVDYIKSILN